MQEINTKITIHAPIEKVWDLLIDLESYHEWNSFTPKVESDLKVGSPVLLHVNMNGDGKLLKQKEQILWVKEGESIGWGIPTLFPVRTERAQILTKIDAQTTEYSTYDRFWGILTPLVMFLYRSKIQKGFEAVARGLKEKAESKVV